MNQHEMQAELNRYKEMVALAEAEGCEFRILPIGIYCTNVRALRAEEKLRAPTKSLLHSELLQSRQ